MSKIEDQLDTGDGPKIVVKDQCAQSPETNALDLGFNKSLDSRLPKQRDFNLDNFEQQILDAYEEYPEDKLDALFDMKQRVCECIVQDGGGNSFKLPHRNAK